MGGRGFPPAPTVIKLAKGERRPSRVNYDEPKFAPPKSLEPPSGLKGPGLLEWQDRVKDLADRGVLTSADLPAFEDYCRALTELRAYEKMAKNAGLEQAISKGYQGMVLKLRAQVNQLRQQCGLTPSSRGGIRAKTASAPANDNPSAKYLRALPGAKQA